MARKCSATGKTRFPSQLEADLTLSNIMRFNNRPHTRFTEEPVRSYHCEFCHDWHLSGQEKRGTRVS